MISQSNRDEDENMRESSTSNAENENLSTRARELILELFAVTSNNDSFEGETTFTEDIKTRSIQCILCQELLAILKEVRETRQQKIRALEPLDNEPFIRTNMTYYNNKTVLTPTSSTLDSNECINILEVLGDLSPSMTAKLAMVLTKLLSHRIENEILLREIHDNTTNVEGVGSMMEKYNDQNDSKIQDRRRANAAQFSAKAPMTISRLGMTAAQLYVELLGMRGAWEAGIVDVTGISAIAALVKRWCVESRGREPANKIKRKGCVESKERCKKKCTPATKKMKPDLVPFRISSRIAKRYSIVDDEEGSSDSRNEFESSIPDINHTLFVEEDTLEKRETMSENEFIIAGLKVFQVLGVIPTQKDYKNWSSEAHESFLDAASVALGASSALLTGIQGNLESACNEALLSLDCGLHLTVSFPQIAHHPTSNSFYSIETASNSRRSEAERAQAKAKSTGNTFYRKRIKESVIILLRALMPILYFKMELPNGQEGKVLAYDTATSLVVKVISRLVKEIVPNTLNNHSQPYSQTPKPVSRKSISFSYTPTHDKNKTKSNVSSPVVTLQPPSLKKTITPTSMRRSTNSAANESFTLQSILNIFIGLLQKLFTSKGLERTESRLRVSKFGIQCLSFFPSTERAHILGFIRQMCHSKKSAHRLLGVELIGGILNQEWFWRSFVAESNVSAVDTSLVMPDNSKDVRGTDTTTSLLLLVAIQGRLTDKSPTVRTRAAMSFSDLVRDVNLVRCESETKSILSTALIDNLSILGTSLVKSLRKRAIDDDKAAVRKASVVAWIQILLLLCRGKSGGITISGFDISALCSLCNDSSVAIRKASAEALTNLVQANYNSDEYTPQASSLEMAWTHAVLPLVRDTEASCVKKTVEMFSALVIEPIVEVQDEEAHTSEIKKSKRYLVAWRILSKISDESKEAGGSRSGTGSLQTAIQKLLVQVGSDCQLFVTNLFKAVYQAVITSIGLENYSSQDILISKDSKLRCDLSNHETQMFRDGAWCLLDALISSLAIFDDTKSSVTSVSISQAVRGSLFDPSFLTHSLRMLRSLIRRKDILFHIKASLIVVSRYCLNVTAKMAGIVPLSDAKTCFSDLLTDLSSFNTSMNLISSTVQALVALNKRLCGNSGSDLFDECDRWITNLLMRCENEIKLSLVLISQRGESESEKEKLSLILFLVGELSMVGFRTLEETSKKRSTSCRDFISDRDSVRGLHIQPSAHLVHLVKLMLPDSIPSSRSSNDKLISTAGSIRAHAFITIGKFCLRNEDLAKECLHILVRELRQNSISNPSVQCNALMVMGDLCVRYTSLVEKYLPFMAASLQAGNVKSLDTGSVRSLNALQKREVQNYSLLKKNAILLLSSLVLQDYIKWKGFFFFRFLAAIADEDDEVSCLAQTAIRGPFLKKQPNLIATSFVQSIFIFNNCKDHPMYASAANYVGAGSLEVDFDGSLLEGCEGYHRRHEVYQIMLANMTDEQKLRVTTDLVKRILGGALETTGDLGIACRVLPNENTKISQSRINSATHVLKDAFMILSSEHIKVGHRALEDIEEHDELITTCADTDHQNHKKAKLLSKISQKHLIEIAIPILCSLKTVLEGSYSPLLKDLMEYLGYIFRCYKQEVVEFLANVPVLLHELEYDTRQFEKKKSQRRDESVHKTQ